MDDGVDPLMTVAWRDFVVFAVGYTPIRKDYEHATGRKLWRPSTSPIENVIDGATDASGQSMMHFAAWVTKNHWGLDGVPADFLKTIDDVLASPPTASATP